MTPSAQLIAAQTPQRHLGDDGGATSRWPTRSTRSTLNAGEQRAAIGLHVTLTAPFKPMSQGFTPLRDGAFLPHRD